MNTDCQYTIKYNISKSYSNYVMNKFKISKLHYIILLIILLSLLIITKDTVFIIMNIVLLLFLLLYVPYKIVYQNKEYEICITKQYLILFINGKKKWEQEKDDLIYINHQGNGLGESIKIAGNPSFTLFKYYFPENFDTFKEKLGEFYQSKF